MKPLTAKCNKSCGRSFTVDKVLVESLHDTIERNYFICPHCQREYTSHHTDASIRDLQRKLRKYRQATGTEPAHMKRTLAIKMNELKQVMQR